MSKIEVNIVAYIYKCCKECDNILIIVSLYCEWYIIMKMVADYNSAMLLTREVRERTLDLAVNILPLLFLRFYANYISNCDDTIAVILLFHLVSVCRCECDCT